MSASSLGIGYFCPRQSQGLPFVAKTIRPLADALRGGCVAILKRCTPCSGGILRLSAAAAGGSPGGVPRPAGTAAQDIRHSGARTSHRPFRSAGALMSCPTGLAARKSKGVSATGSAHPVGRQPGEVSRYVSAASVSVCAMAVPPPQRCAVGKHLRRQKFVFQRPALHGLAACRHAEGPAILLHSCYLLSAGTLPLFALGISCALPKSKGGECKGSRVSVHCNRNVDFFPSGGGI